MQSLFYLKNNIGKEDKRRIGIFINDGTIMNCGEFPIRIFSIEVRCGDGKEKCC